ncbi:tRNA-dihydrouridine synthase [Pseudomonas syringae pv. delphinii]|uniref:tRNA-dihydrouridine synthase n=1 Tax=Pseudomonas syringae pv. delphinii TaxID=192088 RepID=A0A0P9PTI1_9PSED|nr:tRNA-dihydrouridine synthase [Pseudomonas syringae pv. delphinii]RMP16395.1 tRNA-dihydrouridine synthase [Pseudomonas syringae pv. delphinii]
MPFFLLKLLMTMQPDIAPNPHSTRPGLFRRFSVAPMMDWTNLFERY